MRIPLLVDWKDKIERTGDAFHAQCPRCAKVAKMYEAKKRFNVSVFIAVSLWDDEETAIQCGECLGLFLGEDADNVRASKQAGPSFFGSVLSKLRAPRSEESAAPNSAPPKSELPKTSKSSKPAKRAPIDESSIDDELAALKKRIGK
jgi:hypothetical protein